MPRAVLAVLLGLSAGVALGASTQLADHVDGRLAWAGALGVPWLCVAFAVGALLRARGAAALGGAVALVAGTATWYAITLAAGHLRPGPVLAAAGWTPPAALCGAVFGWAGAEWSARRREGLAAAVAVAALAGALVGESLLLRHEWPGRAAQAVLAAELVAGAVLPMLLVRRRAVVAALALTAVAAVVMGAAEHEVRGVLRHAGWQGL